MTQHPEIRRVAPGVHVVETPQRFLGLEMGTRMTVLELEGGLLVHSPVAIEPAALAHLGVPRWVMAPNLFHHLYIGPWIDAGLSSWAPQGLAVKRTDLSFDGVLESGMHPFGDEVALYATTCFSMTHEVAVLHRPSRTLVLCDLVFNISSEAPWTTRAAMRCLCGYPGCRTTLVERFGMRRDVAERDIQALLEWDFDRLIMAHGDIVETGGKEALRSAFHWLLPRT